jgi:hypothetical protein
MLAEVDKATHVAAVAEKSVEAGKELRRVILDCSCNTEEKGFQNRSTLFVLHVYAEGLYSNFLTEALCSVGAKCL